MSLLLYNWGTTRRGGICVFMNATTSNHNGRFYQINLVLFNYSLYPIDVDPSDFEAVVVDKKGTTIKAEPLSCGDYEQKVSRLNLWTNITRSVGQAAGAMNGANNSTATIETTYSEDSPNTTTATTTVSFYDASYAQAEVQVENARINATFQADWEAIDEGYFKHNTVESGKSIAGFINIPYVKGETLKVLLHIAGATYPYKFGISGVKTGAADFL